MIAIRQQRGAALFVGILLITVVVVFAALVALTSATQHLSQARANLAEQAWYTAVGRIEEEIQNIVDGSGCSTTSETVNSFTVDIVCDGPHSVSEGSKSYDVYGIEATASQGNLSSAVFVRRSVRVQVTDLEEGS